MNNHYIHWITVFVFSKEVFELKLSAVLGFVKFYEYTDLTCIMEMEVLTKTLQSVFIWVNIKCHLNFISTIKLQL